MSSVGDLYPVEQARLRTLIEQYAKIGPVGTFGKMMIEVTLKEADEAAISGDVVRMLRAYKAMEGCK